MSFYEKRILPHVINCACGAPAVERQRQKVEPQAVGEHAVSVADISCSVPLPIADCMHILPSSRNSSVLGAPSAKMPVLTGPPRAATADGESALLVSAKAARRPSPVSPAVSSVMRSTSAPALPRVMPWAVELTMCT